jgi:hypothetical protein
MSAAVSMSLVPCARWIFRQLEIKSQWEIRSDIFMILVLGVGPLYLTLKRMF